MLTEELSQLLGFRKDLCLLLASFRWMIGLILIILRYMLSSCGNIWNESRLLTRKHSRPSIWQQLLMKLIRLRLDNCDRRSCLQHRAVRIQKTCSVFYLLLFFRLNIETQFSTGQKIAARLNVVRVVIIIETHRAIDLNSNRWTYRVPKWKKINVLLFL